MKKFSPRLFTLLFTHQKLVAYFSLKYSRGLGRERNKFLVRLIYTPYIHIYHAQIGFSLNVCLAWLNVTYVKIDAQLLVA